MRPSEKLAAIITIIVLLISGISLYYSAKSTYGSIVPIKGGELHEGTVGYARFINPLLAFTDTDKDLVSLIYSGLLKPTPEGGLEVDLAESWAVSEDGLIYTIKLKPDAVFHDGHPVTADDIEFTIQRAADPAVKSVKAANWTGVTVEKVNSAEIRFILKKPYAPFLENLTLGILPKHIWEGVTPEAFDVSTFNKEPIGSGPYKVKSTTQDGTGLYTHYELEPFAEYALGEPYIQKVTFDFYGNEEAATEALLDGDIDALGGLSPDLAAHISDEAGDDIALLKSNLPRIFGLFFNQNSQQIFLNKEVRLALNQSIDRKAMVDSILKGYGSPAYSPIPQTNSHIVSSTPNSTTTASTTSTSIAAQYDADIAGAIATLEKAGWKKGTDGIYEKKVGDAMQRLSFSITTSNSPELKAAAEFLKTSWAAIGAEVRIDIFESSDLAQKVIRPRKYEALLFGQVVGRDIDLYPFWHSSQRNDPGLNIAMYANIKTDKALEAARSSSDTAKQLSARKEFETEILNDVPAIFLFTPNYIYAQNPHMQNTKIDNITEPSERFIYIHKWYLKTSYTWKKQ